MSKISSSETTPGNSGLTATPGFWSRVFAGFVKAREVQAERELARYLANHPDRYLHDFGMTDAEISKLRDAHGV